MVKSENMADVDQGVDVVELARFEEDCELTIIDENSASERTVDKCHRSMVWHYFNKLLGDERLKYTLCGHMLRDCGNLFKVDKL